MLTISKARMWNGEHRYNWKKAMEDRRKRRRCTVAPFPLLLGLLIGLASPLAQGRNLRFVTLVSKQQLGARILGGAV